MALIDELRSVIERMSDEELIQSVEVLVSEASSRGVRGQVSERAQAHRQAPWPIATVGAIGQPGVQSDFDVVLKSVPAERRASVIRAIRQLMPDLPLDRAASIVRDVDAHAVIEERPTKLFQGRDRYDAERIVKVLREAGADAAMI